MITLGGGGGGGGILTCTSSSFTILGGVNFTISSLGFGGGGGGSFFSDCVFAETITRINEAARPNIFFIKQFLAEMRSLKFSIFSTEKTNHSLILISLSYFAQSIQAYVVRL